MFTITSPEGYDWVLPAREEEIELLRFDGTPRASTWVPLKMRPVQVDEFGRPLKESDLPSCSGGEMMMLRQHAVDELGDALRVYGELLPLECPSGPLWAFNVTHLIDALDEERSQVLRSPTGRVLRVKKPEFIVAELAGSLLFKLTVLPRGLIYVTARFVALVESSGLKGIGFRQVWAPN